MPSICNISTGARLGLLKSPICTISYTPDIVAEVYTTFTETVKLVHQHILDIIERLGTRIRHHSAAPVVDNSKGEAYTSIYELG